MEKRRYVHFIIPLFLIISSVSITGCFENGVDRTDWAFEKTQIDDMNDLGFKGEGIIIGIVDTGLNMDHPDLEDMELLAWRDFVNDRAEPYDDRGHGTHVTGIIAADGDLKGAAPKASFVIAKALDANGRGDDGDVANAIDWCADEGAHIICLSLGGDPIIPRLGEQSGVAAREVINRGVVVVAAAGNDGKNDDGDVQKPANVEGVIAVGAVDEDLKIASFSSIGDNDGYLPGPIDDRQDPDKKPEVVAPGVKIRSTYIDDDYAVASGTSQATPFVVAGIALILEEHPEYKRDGSQGGSSSAVEKVKDSIMRGAYELPDQNTPHDDHYGYGLFSVVDSSSYM